MSSGRGRQSGSLPGHRPRSRGARGRPSPVGVVASHWETGTSGATSTSSDHPSHGAGSDASLMPALTVSPTAVGDASLAPGGDAPAPDVLDDASRGAPSDGNTSSPSTSDASTEYSGDSRCAWCRALLSTRQLRWCSKRCRQTAWRCRKVSLLERSDSEPLRLAYADPPFIERAGYYPEKTEVDHVALLSHLQQFDGWALSAGAHIESLRCIVPLLPNGARVCPWVKPIGVSPQTRGPHNAWEVLIVKPARWKRPGKRDWLRAMPARGGDSRLIGRKPLAFCAWLFELLGAEPHDSFRDFFPGSGNVSRAWNELRRIRA